MVRRLSRASPVYTKKFQPSRVSTPPVSCSGPKCKPSLASLSTMPISIIVYFFAAFLIGVVSSMFMTKKETPLIVTLGEILVALAILGYGHKMFTILTPAFIDNPSANIIFAFVAISANGKIGDKVKKVARIIPSY